MSSLPSLQQSDMSSPFNDPNIYVITHGLSLMFTVVLPVICISKGISDASIGIANAADIRIDTLMTILPMCFVNASLIYTLIYFFSVGTTPEDDFLKAVKRLAGAVIIGFGSACAAYAVGKVTKNAVVARAQNKQFSTYFMVMLMFSEAVAILALIMAILGNKPSKEASANKST